MTEISFYHLTTTSLETALPKLLEKSLQGGFRVLVLLESEEKVEYFTNLLWTFDPSSFLPHGSIKDGNAELHPIYLSATLENQNHADLLIITHGITFTPDDNFTRVLDIFDGRDELLVQKARVRWKAYKDDNHALKYMKQSDNGAWKQAN